MQLAKIEMYVSGGEFSDVNGLIEYIKILFKNDDWTTLHALQYEGKEDVWSDEHYLNYSRTYLEVLEYYESLTEKIRLQNAIKEAEQDLRHMQNKLMKM